MSITLATNRRPCNRCTLVWAPIVADSRYSSVATILLLSRPSPAFKAGHQVAGWAAQNQTEGNSPKRYRNLSQILIKGLIQYQIGQWTRFGNKYGFLYTLLAKLAFRNTFLRRHFGQEMKNTSPVSTSNCFRSPILLKISSLWNRNREIWFQHSTTENPHHECMKSRFRVRPTACRKSWTRNAW